MHAATNTAAKADVRVVPWNKGKLNGQKPPLKLKEIWAIRIRLQLDRRARELALFNLAVDSKLRGCDLVGLHVRDVFQGSHVAPRAIVMQKKPTTHKTHPANAAAGPKLAQRLNCVQCHGPDLLGVQHIPRLAGQQYEYLKTQLRGFKTQTRADLDGNMTSAAQALTDNDIDVLVDYISGLGAR